MPRQLGVAERRRQPYWDTLIRGSGAAGAATWAPRTIGALANSPIRLFSSAGTGDHAITNMEGAGQFPGDEMFNIYAMRVNLYFNQCATAGGLTDYHFYHRAVSQLFWEFKVSAKQMFLAPSFFLPAGGGLHGDLGTSTDVYFTNGVPSNEAVTELVKPISLEVRQSFQVNCTVAACGGFNWATDMGNLTAGSAYVSFIIDGVHLRDVV